MGKRLSDKKVEAIQRIYEIYVTEKNLRKTDERDFILKTICTFSKHFDVDMLCEKMETDYYRVSVATIYNTLEVLIDAGIVIRHQFTSRLVQYELLEKARKHIHCVCTRCNSIREIENPPILLNHVNNTLESKFASEYFSLYAYGICSKCKGLESKKNRKEKGDRKPQKAQKK
jgi:Fur family ferric uptake transcriptional regulator